MGRYDQYTDEQLSDDDFIRALLDEEREKELRQIHLPEMEVLGRAPPPEPQPVQNRALLAANYGTPDQLGTMSELPPVQGATSYDATTRTPTFRQDQADMAELLRQRHQDGAAPVPPQAPQPAPQPPPPDELAILRDQPQPPRAPPDYQGAAQRMMAPDPQGRRPNLYGMEDEPPYDPIANGQKTAEAYRALHGGFDQPQRGPSARNEQEFVNSSERPSDDHLMLGRMIHGLFGKDGDDYKSWQLGLGQQRQYDEGLAAARKQDYEESQRPGAGHVDPATAIMMAEAFGLPPDVAARIPANSGAMKLGQSLGAIAPRDKGMELRHSAVAQRELGQNVRAEQRNATQLQGAQIHADASRYGADQRADASRYGADQRHDALTGGGIDKQQLLAGQLIELGAPHERAQDIAAGGDISDLPPALQAKIASARINVPIAASRTSEAAKLAGATQRGNTGLVDAQERAANDPRTLWKTDEALAKDAEPFMNAAQAVLKLKQRGTLQYMSQLGTSGWASMAKNGIVDGEDQAAMGEVYDYMAGYAHARYGANFTKQEQDQLAASTGIKYGSGADPTRDPATVLRFFSNMKRILAAREERATKYFPGLRQ